MKDLFHALKIALVADDWCGSSVLRSALKVVGQYQIVGEYKTGGAAIEVLPRLAPDIVFLSTRLADMPVDAFAAQTQHVPYELVLLADDDSCAPLAFALEALDYVIQPIQVPCLQRVANKFYQREHRVLARQAQRSKPVATVIVQEGGITHQFHHSHIAYIEGLGRYKRLNLTEKGQAAHGFKTLLLEKNLDQLEQSLAGKNFCRIHRSYLVNVTLLRRISVKARRYYAMLAQVTEPLPISRNKLKPLQQKLLAE